MTRFPALVSVVVLTSLALVVAPTWAQPADEKPKATRASEGSKPRSSRPRDIVFIVMDDVGIDQLAVFGLATENPIPLPNIDAIALSGVMFGNVWVMPECSPSRAAFFTGRYPMRTGVTSALIDNMLPVSQVSPYETTIPRVLAQAGYSSALIGKFHLGEANPSGDCSPATLGWDYFNGNLGASPGAIDTTAGNKIFLSGTGPFGCGFDQLNQSGACYQSNGSCQSAASGKACLESGGLFLANEACSSPTPSRLDFSRTNSYYVWQDVVNEHALPENFGPDQCSVEPVISREYMTTAQTDLAVNWWRQQSGRRMVTVAYNSEHTPFQQPPVSLVPDDSTSPPLSLLQCQGTTDIDRLQQRAIGAAMLKAMDLEIGRLLQGMGLATLDANGVIQTVNDQHGHLHIPQLEQSGTMVVIIGDNGTFAYLVRPPFDPIKSKGTVYQTGVWVPLIVAGNLVHGPTGRIDNHLINSVDLFELFGEFAGVDVNQVVPPAHVLDSKPMLIHLTDPDHGETRTTNFTQLGTGVFEVPTNPKTRSWPCLLGGAVSMDGKSFSVGQCSDILFSTRAFCEQENGGIWFGPPDSTDQSPLAFPNPASADGSWNSCCSILVLNPNQSDPTMQTSILPINQWAERDKHFKYVERQFADCTKPLCPGPDCDMIFPPYERKTVSEFYDLHTTLTNPAGLDNDNLACDPATGQDPIQCVPQVLQFEYRFLQKALDDQRNSEVSCTGDGNLDKRVNNQDLSGVKQFQGAGPSIWDFNDDAQTDPDDIKIVLSNLGKDCISLCQRADLNRDGKVDEKDLAILKSHFGPCELCGSDLNGDGVVNELDVRLMKHAIRTCSETNERSEARAGK